MMKLTDEEQAWVQAQLALVDRFVGDYGSGEHGLAGVDRAWASWLASGQEDDAETIINAVAVALGQAVIDALDGFLWVTVFHEDGETDLGVTGRPAVDAIFFPAETVALEYQAHTPSFLVRTLEHYVSSINDERA
jgi:hypothetical protein